MPQKMTIKEWLGEKEKKIDEKYQEIPTRWEGDKVEETQPSGTLSTTDKKTEWIPQKHQEAPASKYREAQEMGLKTEDWCQVYIASLSWYQLPWCSLHLLFSTESKPVGSALWDKTHCRGQAELETRD